MRNPPLRLLWRESHASSAVLAGLIAAVPAALVSAAVMAGADLLARRPAGTTLALIGPVTHVVMSLIFGAVFGVLVAFTAHHLASTAGALWGALYGLAVWFVSFFLVLPWIAHDVTTHTPARVSVLFHLAYGATLGALFHVVRARERERHRLRS